MQDSIREGSRGEGPDSSGLQNRGLNCGPKCQLKRIFKHKNHKHFFAEVQLQFSPTRLGASWCVPSLSAHTHCKPFSPTSQIHFCFLLLGTVSQFKALRGITNHFHCLRRSLVSHWKVASSTRVWEPELWLTLQVKWSLKSRTRCFFFSSRFQSVLAIFCLWHNNGSHIAAVRRWEAGSLLCCGCSISLVEAPEEDFPRLKFRDFVFLFKQYHKIAEHFRLVFD